LHCLENTQGEIPRSARNYSLNKVFAQTLQVGRAYGPLGARVTGKEGETMRAARLRVLACFLLTQAGSAQVPITPKLLTPSSIRNVVALPFNSWGNPACDKDGNMYFHAARSYSEAEILRLSADGSEGKIFKLSDQFPEASAFLFSDFSVSPGGNVYVLGGIPKRKVFLLLRFDQDGKMDEPISPRLPEGVSIDSIIATDNAACLLFGYYYAANAPSELKEKSYMALVDPSGVVRQELHVSIPGLDMAKWAAGQISSPGVALGDDGNFYLAGPNQILVVSLGGDLLRRIPFDNPYSDSRVARLQVSGGLILMTLARVDNHYLHHRYLALLNPSGGVVGYYEPPEQAGGRSVCYSAKQGLTFLKLENGQLKLLTAPLN